MLDAIDRRLQTTLDSIAEAVIATDRDGRIERLNPVAAELTGWALDACRGKLLGEVYRLAGDATPMETFARVIAKPPSRDLVKYATLVRRDGASLPIAETASPIRSATGEVDGIVVVFRDMSAEWAAERERFRLQAARTRAEEELRRIAAASRLKSEFLANMSHELRTPLTAIVGFAELLYDGMVGATTPQQHEFIGDILTSGQHLLRLINDVLDLSKIEAGHLELHPEPIDVGPLVREVTGLLRATAAAKQLQLEVDIEPGLGELRLDPSRLKQVLFNYLSNAIKFTPAGGRVTVRVRAEDADRVRFVVEDTGIGIAAGELDQLFAEFHQIQSGAGTGDAGTGLGLALTKQLVEAQGGEVGVTSEPGVGSRFHAILPRRT